VKITLITACFNSAATIRDTIESVLAQDYAEIEYIIIDGKSTDETLSIVNGYASRIAKIISEKDQGIYYALNKGIALATGDVIGILHADDVYTGPGVISSVMKKMETADAVYGDLQYVDRSNTSKVIRNWKSGQYRAGMFRKGWMPPHPAFFLKKSCYDRFGMFDTSFKTAADYELMLRMIHKLQVPVAYVPQVLVKMRVGGVSNVSLKNRIRANREDKRAWTVNDLKPGMLTLIRKPLSKITQYLK
jgi:glycosyltransferase